MNLPIPTLDVYRNRRDGELVVVHKTAYYSAQVYLGNVACGKIQRFSPRSFELTGLQTVRASLYEFSSRPPDDDAEFEKLGTSGRRSFFRKHQCVGISLRENGDLWLDPVHHEVVGVSGFGLAKERAVITPNHTPQEFYAILNQCFELAD